MKSSALRRIERILLLIFSFVLVTTGVAHILRGSLGWKNYSGWAGLTPLAILFGLLLIYIVLFRWGKLKEKARDRKGLDQESRG